MTPEQAKQLCIEAHKGQWRGPSLLPNKKVYVLKDCPNFGVDGFFINPEGNRVSYVAENGWKEQKPYHTHPIAVANMITTDEEKIVAYLHDVIEDTSAILIDGLHYYYIYFNNIEYEIKKNIYTALRLLTKLPNQSYEEYIKNLSDNRLATKVKLADMFHNMSTSTSEKQKAKYLKHIPILLNTL